MDINALKNLLVGAFVFLPTAALMATSAPPVIQSSTPQYIGSENILYLPCIETVGENGWVYFKAQMKPSESGWKIEQIEELDPLTAQKVCFDKSVTANPPAGS